MCPSEYSPSQDAPRPGDETSLGVPSRDGLVSLSQAAEVLGFRGQELWKMLRGAGITIHRVDWDDCRGSAISLRDLFRLRQAQVPHMPRGRSVSRFPVMPGPLAPPAKPWPAAAPISPVMPQTPGTLADMPRVHRLLDGERSDSQSEASESGSRAKSAADADPLDGTEFGADMDRLRDLVSDAQVRNEYLSVELHQLRSQMASQRDLEADANRTALAAVHEQTAVTLAGLKEQVRASAIALEEAAEALEVERGRSRVLERTVRDLRAELKSANDSDALREARELLEHEIGKAERARIEQERARALALEEAARALKEEREKSARVQQDLERSLTAQRRSLTRLESDLREAHEKANAQDSEALAEAREALAHEKAKAVQVQQGLEQTLTTQRRSLARVENDLAEARLAAEAQDANASEELIEAREALAHERAKGTRVQQDLERSLTAQRRSLERMESDLRDAQLAANANDSEALAELRGALVHERAKATRAHEELERSHALALAEARESLKEEREKATRMQEDMERSMTLQRRSLARMEREKSAIAERLGVRDEVERNNQRYIDRLERQIEELRGGRGR